MSEKTNLTRLKTPKDSELLLSQWASFDSLKYMQATHASSKTISEYLADRIDGLGMEYAATDYIAALKIGQSAGSIDVFRNIHLDTIEKTNVNLSAFPFSMLKLDSAGHYYPTWEIDQGKITNCLFTATNFKYSLAMYAKVYTTMFDNCDLSLSLWVQAKLKGNTFTECDFSYAYFNIQGITNNSGLWVENKFSGCNLSNVIAPELVIYACIFTDCKINNSVFKITDNWLSQNWNDSLIIGCEIKNTTMFLGTFTDSLKIEHTDARDSVFENLDSANKGIIRAENSIFTNSSFKHSKISAECTNNTFINCQFTSSFQLTADADISGSDFTGSNIDNWYATKALLKATGCTYDERTIWVDGTPL